MPPFSFQKQPGPHLLALRPQKATLPSSAALAAAALPRSSRRCCRVLPADVEMGWAVGASTACWVPAAAARMLRERAKGSGLVQGRRLGSSCLKVAAVGGSPGARGGSGYLHALEACGCALLPVMRCRRSWLCREGDEKGEQSRV